jgi:thiol-disulfide isomerase/thioredoxin
MKGEVIDRDRQRFRLEDYRNKVILPNLWATWCGPCIAEFPDLVELQKTYHVQGLEVIGLNIGEIDVNVHGNCGSQARKLNSGKPQVLY